MKVRNGFVSNSSSSSFVLLIDDPKECPTCGVKLSLLTLLDHNTKYQDSRVVLEGARDFEEEIKKIEETARNYFKYYSGFSKKEFKFEETSEYTRAMVLKNAIEEAKLNKEKILAEVEIDYHDEFINSVFKYLVKSKQVIVLSSCEG